MQWIEYATLRTAPLISIVLPTRDRRELLVRAIGSVERQTYQNWELLIVDDGSIDDTPAYLAGLAEARIRSFRTTPRASTLSAAAICRDSISGRTIITRSPKTTLRTSGASRTAPASPRHASTKPCGRWVTGTCFCA
jgi:hypothetical protein